MMCVSEKLTSDSILEIILSQQCLHSLCKQLSHIAKKWIFQQTNRVKILNGSLKTP